MGSFVIPSSRSDGSTAPRATASSRTRPRFSSILRSSWQNAPTTGPLTGGRGTSSRSTAGRARCESSFDEACRLLLLGVLTVLAAFSLTFLGLWVPRQDLSTGLLIAAGGIAVFLLGRGVVIDGTRQIVRRWWGWLYRPVLSTEHVFSTIKAIEIRKKLGPNVPEYGVGRMVHYPLYLMRDGGRPILVKRCPWVSEARFLAEELSPIVSAPVSDQSGEPFDLEEALL